MKTLLILTLLLAGISLATTRDAASAVANGTPIAKALAETSTADPVSCRRSRRVCQKPYGCRKVCW